MKIFKTLFFFALLLGMMMPTMPLLADKTENEIGIPVFREVDSGIYRGGQPTEKGFQHLQTLGVKTIVNFRHEEDWDAWDRDMAAKHGMKYIHLPWHIMGKKKPEVLGNFFKAMKDPENRPLFFHCRRGAERTSVMTALYYIQFQDLSPDEAYEKATEGIPVRWFWKPVIKKNYNYYLSVMEKA